MKPATQSDSPIYRDGRHYDLLNRKTDFDIPFFLERAKLAQGPILELACGTGRVALPLARAGLDVDGLDLSPSMLKRAQEKARSENLKIGWIQGDARNFQAGRKYGLIFIAYDSFLYLYDFESQKSFFDSVKAHLLPGGILILDAFNPNPGDLSLDWTEYKVLASYVDPDGRGNVTIRHRSRYDDASQVLHAQWLYEIGAEFKKAEDIYLRIIFPKELDLIVSASGFTTIEKLGNYQSKVFESRDPHQVVICRPAGVR